MTTPIIILLVVLIAILWLKRRSKEHSVKNEKPNWSIGYALYFLTDIFTQGNCKDEALERVVSASKNGLPNLSDFTSQSTIVGLKVYANAQDDLMKIDSPSIINALSEAVAVEARTTLQMATSQRNIANFIRAFDPEMSNERVEILTEETIKSIQQRPLSEEGEHALHELVKSYLLRSFERYHKKDFYSFSAESSQKLVGDIG